MDTPEDNIKPISIQKQFCDWLQWKDSSSSIFWIRGKAGSGKSTFMNYLFAQPRLRELLNQGAPPNRLVLAGYFFFDRGSDSLQKSREGILRAILYQILTQRRDLVPDLFDQLWGDKGRWQEGSWPPLTFKWMKLKAAFDCLLRTKKADICLFVDGLDKYGHHHDARVYIDALHRDQVTELKREGYDEFARIFLSASKNRSAKLLLSSQPVPAVLHSFAKCPKLRLEDLPHGNIKLYVHDRFMANTGIDTVDGQRSRRMELIHALTAKSSGGFLSVRLVERLLHQVAQGDDFHELRAELERVPPQLGGKDGLYMHMLKDVQLITELEVTTISKLSCTLLGL